MLVLGIVVCTEDATVKPQVLVVDDSKAMRSYIRGALKQHCDCDIFDVQSGFEALRYLARNRIDIVIADINMPNINGHELIRMIRRSGRLDDISILIISTQFSNRDRTRVFDLGANGFLAKPFSSEALGAAVGQLLGSRDRGGEHHD